MPAGRACVGCRQRARGRVVRAPPGGEQRPAAWYLLEPPAPHTAVRARQLRTLHITLKKQKLVQRQSNASATRLQPRGRGGVLLVAVPQLPVDAAAPGEDVAVIGDRHGVAPAAGQAGDGAAGQGRHFDGRGPIRVVAQP